MQRRRWGRSRRKLRQRTPSPRHTANDPAVGPSRNLDELRASPARGRGVSSRENPLLSLRMRPMDCESSPAATADARRQTILVVDDEPSIQLLVRTVLELQGHQVFFADDALEALRLSEQHAGPVDLLITDMCLPAMSGPELVQKLLKARPE